MSYQEPQIFCEIHLSTVPVSSSLTLSCLHKFCSDCLITNWSYLILNSQIDLLKCPKEGCETKITYEELKGNISKELFEKYENFSLNNFYQQNKKADAGADRMIECPNSNCHSKFFIDKNTTSFICPFCKQKFCAICFGEWKEHEALDCKSYQRLTKNGVDVIFETFMEKMKWRRCPNCQYAVEKTGYCNFMRCRSSICQKKVCFCYLCGTGLDEKDYHSHFLDNNPYSDKCKNIEITKKKEKKQEDTNKKDKENNKENNNKIKELNLTCRFCNSKGRLHQNFTDFYVCSKKDCEFNEKIYCTLCQKEFFDEQILDHYCKKKEYKCWIM